MAYATRISHIAKSIPEHDQSHAENVPPSYFTIRGRHKLRSKSMSRPPSLPQPNYVPALDEFSWQEELRKYKESVVTPRPVHELLQRDPRRAKAPLLAIDTNRANAAYRAELGDDPYHPASIGTPSYTRMMPPTDESCWIGSGPAYTTHNSYQSGMFLEQPPQSFFPTQPFATSPEEMDYSDIYGPMPTLHAPDHYTTYEYQPVTDLPDLSSNRSSKRRSHHSIGAESNSMRYEEHGPRIELSRNSVEESRGRSHSRRASEPFNELKGTQVFKNSGKERLQLREKNRRSDIAPSTPLSLKSSQVCWREDCQECNHQRNKGRKRALEERDEGYHRVQDPRRHSSRSSPRSSHRVRSPSKSHKRSPAVTVVVSPGASVMIGPPRSRSSKASQASGMAALVTAVDSLGLGVSSTTRSKRVRFSGINDTWPVSRKYSAPDLKKLSKTSTTVASISHQTSYPNPPGLKSILRKVKHTASPRRSSSRSHSRSRSRGATILSKEDRHFVGNHSKTGGSGSGWNPLKAFMFDLLPPKTK